MADARLIDELAANAMAPRTVRILGAWQLRADPNLPFARTNTTIPFAGEPAGFDVDARIAAVEHFYRDRGLPPRVLIGPSTDPSDLDGQLERRGYVVDSPVDVLTVETVKALALLRSIESPPTRLRDDIDTRWAAKYAEASTRRRIESYARLLAGVSLRYTAVTVDIDGEPAAIGIGMYEHGWVGIFGMATRSDVRRRGAARGVLRAFARWGLDEGASSLYLQVETDNAAARTLYESVGFARTTGTTTACWLELRSGVSPPVCR
jgi:GNAT superfamily N-acetyltransferase